MDEEFLASNFQEQNSLLYNQPDFNDDFLMNSVDEHYDPQHINNPNNPNQFQHSHESQQQKRTRASGEVLALLISEFNKNPNPNASSRKKISDQTGMTERSVRIWFQNRRAKSRKLVKAQANERDDTFPTFQDADFATTRYDCLPVHFNKNYHFIDAKSLTVGSWKRLKSGNLSSDNIFSAKNLTNLSPSSINAIMDNSTDLMIIISKKNFEINYFFSAITQESKILFRIFYPISAVDSCTMSITTEEKGQDPTCESKLFLKEPPKFAVSFTKLIEQNNNQWSICDDFSEAHQVNDAYVNGSGIPHLLHGTLPSLQFLNSTILDFNSSNVQHASFSLPQRVQSKSPTYYQQQPNQEPKAEFPESLSQINTDPQQLQYSDQQQRQEQLRLQQQYQQQQQQQHQQQQHQQLSPSEPSSEFQNAILNEFVQVELVNPDPNDSFDTFLQQAGNTDGDSNLILGLNGSGNLDDLDPNRF